MAEAPLHKIGDVAALLSTSIRAIRYYEEEGLVSPARSAGGTRLYSRRHIDRLRAILRLAAGGYSLEVIKTLAQARARHRSGDAGRKAVGSFLDELAAGIQAQVAQLTALAAQVGAAQATVAGCTGCRNRPTSKDCPQCPVRRHLAEIELLNLIWDEED